MVRDLRREEMGLILARHQLVWRVVGGAKPKTAMLIVQDAHGALDQASVASSRFTGQSPKPSRVEDQFSVPGLNRISSGK